MSELSTIQQTLSPVTVDSLCRDLQKLGVRQGEILLVHSSLSAIGWVNGGEVAAVQGLLAALGPEGTLVAPAQTGANSDPANWRNPPVPESWWETIRSTAPAYDPAITPTRGMGRITECIRTWPGTLRSGHPQVSFCANGPAAGEILASHPLTPQFGMDSPLGALYRSGARVLLLGVGYESCTSLHLAETLSGVMPLTRSGCSMMEDGVRRWVWYEDLDWDTEDFPQVGEAFEEAGGVDRGFVGHAVARLMDLRQLVDFSAQWMRENRVPRPF